METGENLALRTNPPSRAPDPTATIQRATQPQIFMMLVDDWGSYDASWRIRDLGRTPDIATPNIDALSSTGIRFANCVSVVICICF